tara:strand:- start:637 stop:816 length:180 start_codon:yes stop_codon:yes gene_type:complete
MDAAIDEGIPDGVEYEILSAMGGEIADHLCDTIETDGEIACRCACKRELKRKYRKQQVA